MKNLMKRWYSVLFIFSITASNLGATCIKKCSETDNGNDPAHLGITKTWDECRAPNGAPGIMNLRKFADTCGNQQSIEFYCVNKVYGQDVESVVLKYNTCKSKAPSIDH